MYKVEFTESAVKQLKKLDKQTVRVIKNWVFIVEDIENCYNGYIKK